MSSCQNQSNHLRVNNKKADDPVKHLKLKANTVASAKCVSESLLLVILLGLSRKWCNLLEPITTHSNEKQKPTELL